jgi:hypothetical protein
VGQRHERSGPKRTEGVDSDTVADRAARAVASGAPARRGRSRPGVPTACQGDFLTHCVPILHIVIP